MDEIPYDEVDDKTEAAVDDAGSQYLQLRTASNILVPQWNTSNIYGLVAAMLAAIIASVWYECLDDYAKHLYYRMLNKRSGSQCGGQDRFSVVEKLAQAILLMVRLTLGYFLMLCVMTMNTWLLVSVVLGAAIGYGVGRPIVTGVIKDACIYSENGFHVAKVIKKYSKDRRAAQRSRSWRYQPINKQKANTPFQEESEASLSDDQNDFEPTQSIETEPTEFKVIWVKRKSQTEVQPSGSQVHSDDDDVVFRHTPDPASREPAQSLSRFKSTSRQINRSFRMTSTDVEPSPGVRVTRTTSGASTTSATSASRFKPVSKVISDERSKY